VPEPERKVVDAEVVRNAEPHEVEHVKVSRVETSRFFRGALGPDKNVEAGRKGLRDLQFRLWLWLAGLVAICVGCFYSAWDSDVVIWSAFLLIAGVACLLAAAVVGAGIWAVRRLRISVKTL
jgi:hypothetical protein